MGLGGAWPLTRSYGADVRRPGDANPWHRDRAAWTAARWVCVLHPCAATASRSRLTTPREAPSDGPAWAQYESRKVRGDNLNSESEMRRRGMTRAFTEWIASTACGFIRRRNDSPRNGQPPWQLWSAADSLRRWEI